MEIVKGLKYKQNSFNFNHASSSLSLVLCKAMKSCYEGIQKKGIMNNVQCSYTPRVCCFPIDKKNPNQGFMKKKHICCFQF